MYHMAPPKMRLVQLLLLLTSVIQMSQHIVRAEWEERRVYNYHHH